MDGECGAELTTLKLSWFNPVIDGECEALEDYIIYSTAGHHSASVLLAAYALRRRKEAKERQYEPLAGANK